MLISTCVVSRPSVVDCMTVLLPKLPCCFSSVCCSFPIHLALFPMPVCPWIAREPVCPWARVPGLVPVGWLRARVPACPGARVPVCLCSPCPCAGGVPGCPSMCPCARVPGCPVARLPGCPVARLPGCPVPWSNLSQTQRPANTAQPPHPQSETGTLATHSGKKQNYNFWWSHHHFLAVLSSFCHGSHVFSQSIIIVTNFWNRHVSDRQVQIHVRRSGFGDELLSRSGSAKRIRGLEDHWIFFGAAAPMITHGLNVAMKKGLGRL